MKAVDSNKEDKELVENSLISSVLTVSVSLRILRSINTQKGGYPHEISSIGFSTESMLTWGNSCLN